jgi:hypothetical protein
MVGGPGSSGAAATFAAGQWVGRKDATVAAVPNGGSLIIHGTGFVPGMLGRLNPILDRLGRTYIYADKTFINGTSASEMAFHFQLGQVMHAVDEVGSRYLLTVVDIHGVTTLLQYVKE